MVARLLLATRNHGKVDELRRLLGDLEVELLTAEQAGAPEVAETGATFVANALLKARSGAAASRVPAVGDDSGLEVDALGGEPGVRSARYAGPEADAAANVALLLQRLTGQADRRGRFVCAAALALPDGRSWVVQGTLAGAIAATPRGTGGFGYDPVFVPQGETRTVAELDAADKDAISHRGAALRQLRPRLVQVLTAGGPDGLVTNDYGDGA